MDPEQFGQALSEGKLEHWPQSDIVHLPSPLDSHEKEKRAATSHLHQDKLQMTFDPPQGTLLPLVFLHYYH